MSEWIADHFPCNQQQKSYNRVVTPQVKNGLKEKVSRRVRNLCLDLLKVDAIRYYVCKVRWQASRGKLRINQGHGEAVKASTVEYNLTAFDQPRAAFGMGKRMSLILYPLAALLRDHPTAKVLIIGPRTEDDILWARSLGIHQARGLDLFSYSNLIDVGDMHKTSYESQSFDAILIGWTLAYSTQPEVAIAECKRLLKKGGHLGIGMESLPPDLFSQTRDSRANSVNTFSDLKSLVNEDVVFVYNPQSTTNHEIAAIFKLKDS